MGGMEIGERNNVWFKIGSIIQIPRFPRIPNNIFIHNNMTKMFDTRSYTTFATALFDIEVENIIIEPPIDYVGLDIGSCEGIDADKIANKYPGGKIIRVDPSSTREDTIKIDGEEFIQTTKEQYDFIIVKYAIHYFQSRTTFIKNCIKTIKPGGKLYIFTTSPQSNFPWSQQFQRDFEKTCVIIPNFSPNRIINGYWQNAQIRKNTQLCKIDFANLIKFRGISNLYQYSKEEIADELYRIEHTTDEYCMIELVIDQIIFHKKLI